MFCTNCGAKLVEGAMFCTACGAAVKTGKAQDNEEIPSTDKGIDSTRIIMIAILAAIILVVIIGIVLIVRIRSGSHASEPETTEETVETTDNVENNDSDERSPVEDMENVEAEAEEISAEAPAALTPMEDPNGYIIPDSNENAVTEATLSPLSPQELTYARNEIYARHGYVFKSDELNEYFASKTWYSPDPSFDGTLAGIEQDNAGFILDYQQAHNLEYKPSQAVTPDGEYIIAAASVTSITVDDGYMSLSLEPIQFSGGLDDNEGLNSIYAKCSNTQYGTVSVDEPFTNNSDYSTVKRYIEQERELYEEYIENGGDYQSPLILVIDISGGEITRMWTSSP